MNERHILQHMYYMHCIVHCIYVQCIPTLHTTIMCMAYNYIQCRAPPPPCLSFDAPPPCRPPRCTASPWYAIGPASIETPSPYHRVLYSAHTTRYSAHTIHIQYTYNTTGHDTTRDNTIRYDTIRYGTTGYDTITYALPAR